MTTQTPEPIGPIPHGLDAFPSLSAHDTGTLTCLIFTIVALAGVAAYYRKQSLEDPRPLHPYNGFPLLIFCTVVALIVAALWALFLIRRH